MAKDRHHLSWPPTRRDLVGLGTLLLFAAGLVIIGFSLANGDTWLTVLGIFALALPLLRWVRVRREADGSWEFTGVVEKPPDSVKKPDSKAKQSRDRSA